MLDILGGGVLGSLIGGLFRLAPEILRHLDKKNDRAHEEVMFDKQCDLEKVRGSIKLGEIGAQRDASNDAGVLVALKSAIDQQTEMAKAAGGWIAALSASVRPVVTYSVVGAYLLLQMSMAVKVLIATGDVAEVYKFVMTADFVALVNGTISYWFLSRTLEKRGLA